MWLYDGFFSVIIVLAKNRQKPSTFWKQVYLCKQIWSTQVYA